MREDRARDRRARIHRDCSNSNDVTRDARIGNVTNHGIHGDTASERERERMRERGRERERESVTVGVESTPN